jgi:truncated hemoglobin YjbI
MYLIDQRRVFDELGLEKLVELSTAFYRRVAADADHDFRAMFPEDMSGAIQNQYEFFAQRFGGPQLYTERKGHPALRARHAGFHISEAFAHRWLGHMRRAMAEVGISGEVAAAMDEYFADTALFLVNRGESGERLY